MFRDDGIGVASNIVLCLLVNVVQARIHSGASPCFLLSRILGDEIQMVLEVNGPTNLREEGCVNSDRLLLRHKVIDTFDLATFRR